ncbi:MAG: hypothetical protein M3P85_00125, partial [Actinomycetota bacterium]|nr:hypothetical protein [Actinomycetota bacterium]
PSTSPAPLAAHSPAPQRRPAGAAALRPRYAGAAAPVPTLFDDNKARYAPVLGANRTCRHGFRLTPARWAASL